MQTAVNPQTGETAVLVDGAWKKADQVASSADGKKAFLVGGSWMTDDGPASLPTPESSKPTLRQKIQASAPMRMLQGMRDPIDAGAQLLPRGLEFVSSLGGLAKNPVSDFFGSEAKRVDAMNAQNEQEYQASRNANNPSVRGLVTGQNDPGIDLARIGGNMLSPANAAIAAKIPIASGSLLGLAGKGAALGAVGGALTPVNDPAAQDNFAAAKAAQVGIGAATGGVLTPVLSKAISAIAPKVNALIDAISPARSAAKSADAIGEANKIVVEALRDIGAKADDVNPQQIAELQRQVVGALKDGKKLDAAALLRKQDFDAIGVNPTLGQLTRDATQFARERNLRGVPGVGEPLQARFDQQNQALQQLAAGLRGSPSEPYQAGRRIMKSLSGVDAQLKRGVDNAYGVARDHLGRAAPMDVPGFSKAANAALDDAMLGSYLPAEARGILNDVSSGKIPFNVNTAVQIDSVLSGAQRAAGARTPQSLAIGKLRDALNSASIADNVGEDAKRAFDAARSLAKQRFDVHEAVPGLRAAVDREAPDRFVNDYIIGGNVDEVRRLAQMLRTNDQQAFNEARSQIGAQVVRAAFGENTAGDKLATPERLAKELRKIGTDKLSAFYSPEEIDRLKVASRVAAYINSSPGSAPVNSSNNIGMITSIASRVPGVHGAVAIGNALRNIVNNQSTVNAGVKAAVPSSPNITPEQAAQIARLLSASGAAAGTLAAPNFRQ